MCRELVAGRWLWVLRGVPRATAAIRVDMQWNRQRKIVSSGQRRCVQVSQNKSKHQPPHTSFSAVLYTPLAALVIDFYLPVIRDL